MMTPLARRQFSAYTQSMRLLLSAFVAVAILFPSLLAATVLTQVGAAAAVKGKVQSVAAQAGAVGRNMASGLPVYLNDKVTTDAEGRMQVLLMDETVFTIGPSASMVLDEFVYDPAKGAGKLSATITKGAFRFVSGKIAKNQPSNMKVKLPVGVIGIRGTIVAGYIEGGKEQIVLLGPGAGNNANERAGGIEVSNNGNSVPVWQPGWMTTVEEGKAPTAPVEAPKAFLDFLAKALATTPDPQKKSSGKDGGKSASAEAGESDADASFAADLANLGDLLAADLGGVSATATQDAAKANDIATVLQQQTPSVPNGFTSWDQMNALSNLGTVVINEPSGVFTGNQAAIGCGSGFCDGSYTYSMSIGFGTRSITGGGTITMPNPTISDSFNIAPTPFSTGSGSAGVSGPTSSGFGLYSFSFNNVGGVAAKQMTVNVSYNDNIYAGSGTDTKTVH